MDQKVADDANKLSQEEVTAAETAEQASLNQAQQKYLMQRVVLLRTQNNRLQNELAKAKAELEALKGPSENSPEGISDEQEDKTD